MRKLQLVLFCLGIALASCSSPRRVQAEKPQVDSLITPASLIKGHYYTKDLHFDMAQNSSFVGISGIKCNDFKVFVYEMADSFQIPDEWKKYEIPRERVRNLKELEEAYQTNRKVYEITTSHVEGAPRDSVLGDFSLKDLDGKTWNRTAFLGHIVVVNMWFSGCGPCLREMPELSTWKAKYPDVLFFSANFEKADKVRRITTQRGFNWTHLVEDSYFLRWVGTAGYPATIVIDPKGKVRAIVDGSDTPQHRQVLATIEEIQKEKQQ